MNTTGMMFIASPFMVWADYTWGKTLTLLVQQGIPASPNSDKWLYRINNIGFISKISKIGVLIPVFQTYSKTQRQLQRPKWLARKYNTSHQYHYIG